MPRFTALKAGFLIRSVSVAAAAIVILALPAPARAVFAGANGKIAYNGIITVNPDGTDATSISHPYCPDPDGICEYDTEPAWSPDGTKIAFAHFFANDAFDPELGYTGDLYVMDANGENPRRLTGIDDSADPYHYDTEDAPAWSPDGHRISFNERGSTYSQSCRSCFITVSANGGYCPSYCPGAYGHDPAWSPDGAEVAYEDLDGDIAEVAACRARAPASSRPTRPPTAIQTGRRTGRRSYSQATATTQPNLTAFTTGILAITRSTR